jgi:hypothetical protein
VRKQDDVSSRLPLIEGYMGKAVETMKHFTFDGMMWDMGHVLVLVPGTENVEQAIQKLPELIKKINDKRQGECVVKEEEQDEGVGDVEMCKS